MACWQNGNQQQSPRCKHLAENFSKKLYVVKDKDDKYDEDESSGRENFHLCKKLQSKTKPIVLLNQSVDGSI